MSPTEKDAIGSALFSRGTAFSEADRQLLLEQYKLFVETSENLVSRRQAVNSFFLSANSALLAAMALLSQTSLGTVVARLAFLAIGGAGVLVSVEWYVLLRSYRQLNEGKFQIIHLMEQHLPASLFRAEWIALGEGKDSTRYKPVTSVERNITIAFILLFVLVVVARLSFP